MQVLSDLLISRGIDPAGLENYRRCEICRMHGPELHKEYQCNENVCRDLWGDLARLHWEKPSEEDNKEKKDIKEVFRDQTKTLLNTVLGRKKR